MSAVSLTISAVIDRRYKEDVDLRPDNLRRIAERL
jgi:hypothetical protein